MVLAFPNESWSLNSGCPKYGPFAYAYVILNTREFGLKYKNSEENLF